MENKTTISRTVEGAVEKKEIYELAEIDNDKYRLMGQSAGINMAHCVQLGSRHADDFWHRVCGYKIVQNDKTANMVFEAMKKIKPETQPYVAVAFYERLSDHRVMFVPHRLEIPDRPELNNFPLNIAFGTICLTDDDAQRHETSLYEPDFQTFMQEGAEQKMKYYNNLNPERRFWVEIVYNTNDQTYVGTKYRDDKNIGSAYGTEWKIFFVHLTMLGVGSNQ